MPAPTPVAERQMTVWLLSGQPPRTTARSAVEPGDLTLTQELPSDLLAVVVEWNLELPSSAHWNVVVRTAGQGRKTRAVPAVRPPEYRHMPDVASDDSELISLRYRSAV